MNLTNSKRRKKGHSLNFPIYGKQTLLNTDIPNLPLAYSAGP